ncbi:MAG: hypothetical protein IPO83_15495 [Chitinophagaceae bacterium]|nr:hypothetical protein [Chitinophagaceae bacterium]
MVKWLGKAGEELHQATNVVILCLQRRINQRRHGDPSLYSLQIAKNGNWREKQSPKVRTKWSIRSEINRKEFCVLMS